MANINVLITGAGAPGIMGTFFSLRNQSNHTFRIIGTDIDSEAVGKFFLDQTYVVPKPSQEFIDRVLEICKQEEVQVILPQVTKELEWFSKNKEIFK
ncbi:MAG: ATP-dependent carboxylate-amine ligase, partial [Candidatus Omnitrophica bacterium]|nr:ATP-dependent carboxylate-amine ligase [Candidatus Omnitrophota bacterium]